MIRMSVERPQLTFAIHEDGAIELLTAWFPRVEFAEDLLSRIDGRRLVLRGDELTITATNGWATYALGQRQPGGARVGTLMRSRKD